MRENTYKDCAVLIHRVFDMPEEKHEWSREGLIEWLGPEVQRLLNQNFERLLQICYRIDLGEEKLKTILYKSKPEEVSRDLTEALVDRQILKVRVKATYKP